MRHQKPPTVMLKYLYAEHRLTLHDIAALYGCSYQTVHRWVKADKLRPPKLSKWQLIVLYCNQRLSSRQIAEKTGYSFGTILRWLKDYAIPIRHITTRTKEALTFGQTIQYLQREYGMITRHLVQQTGIDAARLTRIKRHTTIPTEKEREKLCNVLQFSWNNPIELDEEAVYQEQQSRQIVRLIAILKATHGCQHASDMVDCPVCQHPLYYGVSATTGQTWGACETEGCLRWIE